MESSELLKVLGESLPAMIGYWNSDLRNEYASNAYSQYMGWSPEKLKGAHLSELLGPQMFRLNLPYVQLVLAGQEQHFERTVTDTGGRVRHLQISYVPRRSGNIVVGFIAQIFDVTDKVNALNELEESRREFRMLAENASDVVWQLDSDSTMTWVSPSLESVMGWTPEELIGTKPRALTHPDDQEEMDRRRADMFDGKAIPTAELRMRCADGEYRWMSIQVRSLAGEDGRVVGAVVGLRDVHEAVLSRRALTQSEEILRLAIDQSAQGMAVESLEGQWLITNAKLASLLGHEGDWLREHRVLDLMHPHDADAYVQRRDALLMNTSDAHVAESRFIHTDGSVIWLRHSARVIRDERGHPTHLVSQYEDVTAARADRAALESLATIDELTGLPNRRALTSHLEQLAGELANDPDLSVAVLFGDVDDFKSINDTHGHATGDLVLKVIAQRLRAATRREDFLARISGDEFLLIVSGVPSRAAATAIAEELKRDVGATLPIDASVAINPSISFGVAHSVGLANIEELVEGADQDLFRGKHLRSA